MTPMPPLRLKHDYNLGRLMSSKFRAWWNTILIMINDNGVTEGLDVYNANTVPRSVWQVETVLFLLEMVGKWKPKLNLHLDLLPTANWQVPPSPEDLIPKLEVKACSPWSSTPRTGARNAYSFIMLPAGPAIRHIHKIYHGRSTPRNHLRFAATIAVVRMPSIHESVLPSESLNGAA